MNIPKNLKYSKTNEWVLIEDAIATIGITDYAQEALGDITFIELPDMDKGVRQFDELSAVESVKAAVDIFSPVAGHVCEVNERLENSPENINNDPYGAGWIAKLDHLAPEDMDKLMNADEYAEHVKTLKH